MIALPYHQIRPSPIIKDGFWTRGVEFSEVFKHPGLWELAFKDRSALLPGEHLFRNDVSFRADCPPEKFSFFENWRADFAESEQVKDLSGGLFDAVPQNRLGREQVAG